MIQPRFLFQICQFSLSEFILILFATRAQKKTSSFFADKKNNPYFCTDFEKDNPQKESWRGGRVVDCGGLENRCTARYPGFESLSLRRTYWTKKDSKRTKTYKSAICRFFIAYKSCFQDNKRT